MTPDEMAARLTAVQIANVIYAAVAQQRKKDARIVEAGVPAMNHNIESALKTIAAAIRKGD